MRSPILLKITIPHLESLRMKKAKVIINLLAGFLTPVEKNGEITVSGELGSTNSSGKLLGVGAEIRWFAVAELYRRAKKHNHDVKIVVGGCEQSELKDAGLSITHCGEWAVYFLNTQHNIPLEDIHCKTCIEGNTNGDMRVLMDYNDSHAHADLEINVTTMFHRLRVYLMRYSIEQTNDLRWWSQQPYAEEMYNLLSSSAFSMQDDLKLIGMLNKIVPQKGNRRVVMADAERIAACSSNKLARISAAHISKNPALREVIQGEKNGIKALLAGEYSE